MTRRITAAANRAAKMTRLTLEQKQAKKINHLLKKYTPEFTMPPEAKEYSNMKIFQTHDDLEAKNITIQGEPLVIGCNATQDEKKVLLLPPKLAVMKTATQQV